MLRATRFNVPQAAARSSNQYSSTIDQDGKLAHVPNLLRRLLIVLRVAAARFRKSMARQTRASTPSFPVLTKLQIPQARLVTIWWLVFTTFELEREYGNLWSRHFRSHGDDVEIERRERNTDEISRRGTILPKSIVSAVPF